MSGGTFYDRILTLNAAAAESGQFEMAYHLLAAALHSAEVQRDRYAMEEVIRLAAEQGATVDAAGDHPMSSSKAKKRGTVPLYESLAATARGKLAVMDSQRIVDEHHRNVAGQNS